MSSTDNEHIRKPLQIKELRPLESGFRREVSKELIKQAQEVFTKNLIGKTKEYYKNIASITSKAAKPPEDSMLSMYIDGELDNHSELQEDSESSLSIKDVLIFYILQVILIGLKLDKIKTIKQLRHIDDDRIRDVIENININVENITNIGVLDYINRYTSELVVGINTTTKKRIKTIVYNGVRNGDSIDDIAKRISQLEQIAKRRSYTIARTEVGQAKSYENRLYLEKRGYEYWEWVCNAPVDICLVNCGAVRRIGEYFPSGNIAPLVHPCCQCGTVGHIPPRGYGLELFIGGVLLGFDWMGE